MIGPAILEESGWFQKHRDSLPANWVEDLTAFQAEADAVLQDR